MKRLILIVFTSGSFYLLWLLMEEADMLTYFDDRYVLLIGIIPVGFLLNLIFYSKVLSNRKLVKSEVEIKTIDVDEQIMQKINKEEKNVVKEEKLDYKEDEIRFSDEG